MAFKLNEIEHAYGDHVHILDDPFLTTQLARLCSPKTTQPLFNGLVKMLYTSMIRRVINHAIPRRYVEVDTRMKASTPNGVFRGEVIDEQTKAVVVDIARAGILPSQICYDTLNGILDPRLVRQDHLIMARTVDAQHQVTGAAISGSKIGGPVDDCIVLFPDPMGATGNSLATAMGSYLDGSLGAARQLMTLNLIVTPEFIRRISALSTSNRGANVSVYALRLDRGMSPPDVLATPPGARWAEESGLDAQQYIVPGGGGFGELMNNSWI